MRPTPLPLREWLVGIVSDLAPTFEDEIGDHTPLGDDGLCLDSINLLNLIGEIEQGLGVRIHEDQVSPANFGTIGRLLAFVRGLPQVDC